MWADDLSGKSPRTCEKLESMNPIKFLFLIQGCIFCLMPEECKKNTYECVMYSVLFSNNEVNRT